jgi:hypothetical protein
MEVYRIKVDASPRYPVWKAYDIEASNWHTAISRAVIKYFDEVKHLRTNKVAVVAEFIMKKGGDKNDNG